MEPTGDALSDPGGVGGAGDGEPDRSFPDDAAEADLQEQRRDPLEAGFDPEQTTQPARPGVDTEADAADVHDQSLEVPQDDEFPPD